MAWYLAGVRCCAPKQNARDACAWLIELRSAAREADATTMECADKAKCPCHWLGLRVGGKPAEMMSEVDEL